MSSGKIPKKVGSLGFFEIKITQTQISQTSRNLEEIMINLFFGLHFSIKKIKYNIPKKI